MAIAWCQTDVRRPTAIRSLALQRLHGKQQIVAELIGGRLTLLDASTRFGALAEDGRGEEAICREVIGWAHLALCDRPETADAVSSRFEAELERHLSRQGTAHPTGRGHD